MKSIPFLAVIFIVSVFFCSAGRAETPPEGNSASSKVTRNYPHGQDEEDLKVQPELVKPVVVVDRKSIEQKVLKNFLKKSTEDESTSAPSTQKTQ